MLKLLKKHGYGFVMKIMKDRVDASSAQVAFFIFISFIPFLMFLLSLLQLVHISGTSVLNSLIMLLPDTAANFVTSLFRQSGSTQVTILSVTAVTMLWTSSTGIFAMIKALNLTFKVDLTASYIKVRAQSILYTVLFAVVLVFTIALYVFADPLFQLLVDQVNESFANLLLRIKDYVGFSVLFVFFMLTFKLVPRKARIKLRYAAVGAIIATLGWIIFSFFFSLYVDGFSRYVSVYGSLAAIIVVMLWLYFLMTIMFISAEIVAWLQMSTLRRDIREFRGNKRSDKSVAVKPGGKKQTISLRRNASALLNKLSAKLAEEPAVIEMDSSEIFPGQKAPDFDEIKSKHLDIKQQKIEKRKLKQERKNHHRSSAEGDKEIIKEENKIE